MGCVPRLEAPSISFTPLLTDIEKVATSLLNKTRVSSLYLSITRIDRRSDRAAAGLLVTMTAMATPIATHAVLIYRVGVF